MKKSILLFLLLVFNYSIYSQTLSLVNTDHMVPINYGDTILVVDSANVSEMILYVRVTNNAADTSVVFCKKKYINTIVPGSDNVFCWGGGCWPSNMFVSPDPEKIASGETSTAFATVFGNTVGYGLRPFLNADQSHQFVLRRRATNPNRPRPAISMA